MTSRRHLFNDDFPILSGADVFDDHQRFGGGAIRAHAGFSATDSELSNLIAYVSQIGNQETAPTASTPGTGTGLRDRYFNDAGLQGAVVLERIEPVNFSWSGSPGPGVNADAFSVRWTGFVEAPSTGTFSFRTQSNDGVRVWINGALVIDHWASHSTAYAISPDMALVKHQRYPITIEMYDNGGTAVSRLSWKKPGDSAYSTVSGVRLYAN